MSEPQGPTSATLEKRRQLIEFIKRALAPHLEVQGVIAIGSVAAGLARAHSDIDAIVFFDPLDLCIVPAEFGWCPSDGSFHSISADSQRETTYQLDLTRLFDELCTRLMLDGGYAPDVTTGAFIRSHDEPGRSRNMNVWNETHRQRLGGRPA
jgi:predicted nucleotidyltransferase